MNTTLTIEQIEQTIVGSPDAPYYIRNNIVIPNVDWGFLNHEADLLIINKTKRLVEIEIKRSWSDFMADFKKSHTHFDKKLSYLYYAVPYSIAERVFNWLYVGEFKCDNWGFRYNKSNVTEYTERNPHKCGLIIYGSAEEVGNYKYPLANLNVAARPMNDYKLSTDEELKLLRLLGMRIWNLKKKLTEYQAEPSLFKQK